MQCWLLWKSVQMEYYSLWLYSNGTVSPLPEYIVKYKSYSTQLSVRLSFYQLVGD